MSHNDAKDANAPASNGKPTARPAPGAPVIRLVEVAEESAQERLLKKHLPAWVVSGAVNIIIVALLAIFGVRSVPAKPAEKVIDTTAEKSDVPDEKNLTNEDPGLDSSIEAALPEIERQDKQTVDEKVTTDNIGKPDAPDLDTTAYNTPGLNPADLTSPGLEGEKGNLLTGTGGERGTMFAAFPGRSGATKSRLIREGGGNADSERAVALGLAWLARQQQQNGSWVFDQGEKEEVAAATGLALLPFLAAGETHKRDPKDKEKKYQQTVERGLNFLKSICPLGGATPGRLSTNMYAQGIAAMALCEAYGMTKDPTLRSYAQVAINYIQRAQGPNGSWGYGFGDAGDTSIVGWQIQALKAAQLSKDLVVDDRVIKKAIAFLNNVSAGSKKSMYGYATRDNAAPGTALTAVGLLCRYYVDGWGPNHPGMTDGVGGLMKRPPVGEAEAKKKAGLKNMYYYYYATQVVHFFEGDDWKTWNEGPKAADGTRKGGMRDWLVGEQNRKDGKNLGSWDPESGFGSAYGRLGTTALALLTLEVYYRHLPLYKRGADGGAVKIIEDVK